MKFDKKLLKPITVIQNSPGNYIGGEYQEGSSLPEEIIDMVPIPVTHKVLKTLPEGQYTTQDMKFYTNHKTIFNEKTILKYKENQYEIKDMSDRLDQGGYVIYFAKRNSHD